MNTEEAIRAAAAADDITLRELCNRMNRSAGYLGAMFGRGSTPNADTLARIASATGYKLVLAPMGKPLPDGSIVIDAPNS